MKVEVYSFFSGLGFLDLGFESAGFKIEFVNECNAVFLDAYKYARRNSQHKPKYGYNNMDIRQMLVDKEWNLIFTKKTNNLVGFIGGPPCPDFSAAGKNKGRIGENGILTDVYSKLIVKRQPDFFVFENVKGLYHTKKHREFYEKIKRRFVREGYSLFDSVENALEYGVPQYRERLILIGFKKTRFGKNLDFHIGNSRSHVLNDILSINWPGKDIFQEDSIVDPPNEIINNLSVEHWFEKNNVCNHANSTDFFNPKSIVRFTKIMEGDTSGKSFKRLNRWRYAPTSAYGHNEVHLHPYKKRRISVAEALAIQSLPASFELPKGISLSDKFKMVGNGVPYLMACGIATDIYNWLGNYAREKEEKADDGPGKIKNRAM